MGLFDFLKKDKNNQQNRETVGIKLFYYDNNFDEGIKSNAAEETKQDIALNFFKELSKDSHSFIGFEDSINKCIQFAWQEKDIWLVDIPNPPDFINFQQYANEAECIAIIKTVYKTQKITKLPKMVKVKIMEETLEDVL